MLNNILNDNHLKQLRRDVYNTMQNYIPSSIYEQLYLVSDTINGGDYKASWITDDLQHSVSTFICNCKNPSSQVQIVKFNC